MREAGFSAEVCLDLDLALERFDLWLEARQAETVEEPMPRQANPTIRVPRHRDLYGLLGIERPAERDEEEPHIEDAAAAILRGDIGLLGFGLGPDGE